MFFLHVLLFYLLVPSVHSDEGVHWKQVLKNVAFKNKKNKWYWLPPQIYQVSEILLIFNQAFFISQCHRASLKRRLFALTTLSEWIPMER